MRAGVCVCGIMPLRIVDESFDLFFWLRRQTCLHYAAGSGSVEAAEICRLLLDAAPSLINLQDKEGTSR